MSSDNQLALADDGQLVEYIHTINPDKWWYPPGWSGFFVRIRGIFVAIAVNVVGIVASWIVSSWYLFVAVLISATSIGFALWTIRKYRIRRNRTEDALHNLTHFARKGVHDTRPALTKSARHANIEKFNHHIVELVAEYFRCRNGDTTIDCIIRLANLTGTNVKGYVTVGRSKGLEQEREDNTIPLLSDEGLANAFMSRHCNGAFLIRSLDAAKRAGIWKDGGNDGREDAKTFLVAPINGWSNGKFSMLGILHITARTDRFQSIDWLALRAVCDLIGTVYPRIYNTD